MKLVCLLFERLGLFAALATTTMRFTIFCTCSSMSIIFTGLFYLLSCGVTGILYCQQACVMMIGMLAWNIYLYLHLSLGYMNEIISHSLSCNSLKSKWQVMKETNLAHLLLYLILSLHKYHHKSTIRTQPLDRESYWARYEDRVSGEVSDFVFLTSVVILVFNSSTTNGTTTCFADISGILFRSTVELPSSFSEDETCSSED